MTKNRPGRALILLLDEQLIESIKNNTFQGSVIVSRFPVVVRPPMRPQQMQDFRQQIHQMMQYYEINVSAPTKFSLKGKEAVKLDIRNGAPKLIEVAGEKKLFHPLLRVCEAS